MDRQTDIGFEVEWEKNEIDGQTDIGFEVEWEKNEIDGQTDRQTLVSKLNEKSRFFIRFPSI